MVTNKRKLVSLLLAVVMLMIAATGCGGNTPGATTAAATSSETTRAAEQSSQAAATSSETTVGTTVTEATSSAEATSPSGSDASEIAVLALKGPTAIGLVDLMNRSEMQDTGEYNYRFTIAGAPDEAAAAIVKGEVDIAAVPANMAAVLYKKTEGAIRVFGINTLGVLYLCGSDDGVKSLADLEGRKIYASGKGATPEYVLSYLLEKNGVHAEIEWKSEHTECVAALNNDPQGIAMLPQPFASAAAMKSAASSSQNPPVRLLVDLTAEWDKLQENAETRSALITGVIVVRKEFAEQNPQAIRDFISYYDASVKRVNENTEEIGALVEKFGIVPAKVANLAIPHCNIVLITGEEMQSLLSEYLKVLFDLNPKSVGGGLPGEDFYLK